MAIKTVKNKKAEEEGNTFIQEREKKASQLMRSGAAPKQAQTVASQELTQKSESSPMALAQKQLEQQKVLADLQAQQNAILTPEQQQAQAQNIKTAKGVGTLTEEQKTREAVKSEGAFETVPAAVGGITGAVAGAGAGAVIGSIVPGVGTVIGGAIGGVLGGLGGTFAKISIDKRQDVKSATAVFTGSKNNMQWIINQANKGNLSPIEAADMWDEELANFYAAERNIKKDTNTDLGRFLSDGADEAAKIEAFKRRIPQLQAQLEMAILNPNPNNQISLEQDTTET